MEPTRKANPPKSKNWSITYNKPTHTQQEFFELLFRAKGCIYAVVQQEKVETQHFQCCIGFQNQVSFNTIQKLVGKGPHVEPSRNALASFRYCQKEESRIPGTEPMVHGVAPAAKNIAGDTAARNKLILELGAKAAVDNGLIHLEKLPQLMKAAAAYHGLAKHENLEKLENEWHWGVTGAGKSHNARAKYPDSYLKTNTKWWDGYEGQENVLIEELAPDKIGASHMKQWADKYEFAAEFKGAVTKLRPKRIIVTSNYSIEQCWPQQQDHEAIKRRFNVTHYADPFGVIKK